MKIYWYESKLQPLTIGTQPRNEIAFEPSHINERGKRYGAVAYPFELAEEDLFIYDLKLIPAPRALYEWEVPRQIC